MISHGIFYPVFEWKSTNVLEDPVSAILILFVKVQVAEYSDISAHCRRNRDRGNSNLPGQRSQNIATYRTTYPRI